MEINKKLLFVTLILFLVFMLSILKKGNFLAWGSLLVILSLFSYNVVGNKKMTGKNKIYVGSILFLFFVWLFAIIYNSFNTKQNVEIEQFNSPSKQKQLSAKDYEELFFVLKTFMNLEYDEIRTVIIENDLNSVFDLADRIKKFNKPKQVFKMSVDFYLNNDTGIVTLTKTNKPVKKVKAIESYLTNRKMIAFADLIQIPGFSLELIVKLVNVYKIPNLSTRSYQRILTALNISNENKPVEELGLKYITNNAFIEDSFFELLKFILGDKNLVKSRLNPSLENSTFSLRERINLAVNNPNRKRKDMNTLLVLFKHYEMISNIDLITLEDLIKNKRIMISKPSNSENSAAIKNINNEIESVLLSTLNTYDLENDIFDIELFTTYKIKTKIEDILDNKKIESVKSSLHNFGEIKKEEKENKDTSLKKFLNRQEYLTINQLNEMSNEEEIKTDDKMVLNIRKNFSDTINGIIEEMTMLINNNPNYDAINREKMSSDSLVDKYLFYFKNILAILTREGRMLYTGMILLLIAILVVFIEISYY